MALDANDETSELLKFACRYCGAHYHNLKLKWEAMTVYETMDFIVKDGVPQAMSWDWCGAAESEDRWWVVCLACKREFDIEP